MFDRIFPLPHPSSLGERRAFFDNPQCPGSPSINPSVVCQNLLLPCHSSLDRESSVYGYHRIEADMTLTLDPEEKSTAIIPFDFSAQSL
jgi:hypothetical protein